MSEHLYADRSKGFAFESRTIGSPPATAISEYHTEHSSSAIKVLSPTFQIESIEPTCSITGFYSTNPSSIPGVPLIRGRRIN
ncbi:hypothetical protein AFLA_007114 [Aspergillus flavus NRRL3357]|nr:hypothetical protein AFLA_007114 [Aspergillus flavus NRRL3357]